MSDGSTSAPGLAAHLADLVRHLDVGDRPMDPSRLVDLAVRAVPGGRCAGITFIPQHGSPTTMAASSDLPEKVDALQYRFDEGPCLQAIEDNDLVVADDLAHDQRWPKFAPECVAAFDVHSMLGVRLMLAGGDRAALNFYAHSPGAFGDLSADTAALFAPFVALSVDMTHHRDRAEALRAELTVSRQVGIATGMLMALHLLTYDQAYERLSQAGARLGGRLEDVAAFVAANGRLPSL